MRSLLVFLFMIVAANAQDCPQGFYYKTTKSLKGCVKQVNSKMSDDFIIGQAEIFVQGSWFTADFDTKGKLKTPYELYHYTDEGHLLYSITGIRFNRENSQEIYKILMSTRLPLEYTFKTYRTRLRLKVEEKEEMKLKTNGAITNNKTNTVKQT